jgi:hypothetical protein
MSYRQRHTHRPQLIVQPLEGLLNIGRQALGEIC